MSEQVMEQKVVLGVAAGRCGLRSLTGLLNRQRGTQVSHQEPPLMPWERMLGRPSIREKIERWRRSRDGLCIGDISSSYLPYVADAIECEPDVRIVCLKRPKEEVVRSFCGWLDRSSPLRINHWAKDPAKGWHHDAYFSRLFPQYDLSDREEGIRRYWDEYYDRAEDYQRRFPKQFRIFDMELALNTRRGVEELLTFVGIPQSEQVVEIGMRINDGETKPKDAGRHLRMSADPKDPRRCIILVPFMDHIVQACDDALKELERRGYPVRRVRGYAAIDQGRNQMATDAMLEGFEETMWIDADVGFHPDAVDQLRSYNLPIVSGIYPQKGKRALASHIAPGTPRLTFGRDGGLQEILYAATGFLLIRREVYLTIQQKLELPICNERFRHPMIPYFQPMLQPYEDGYWYLAEDYAFCQRARDCGFKIMADTTIRLWHYGMYGYGWEDAGVERERHSNFTLHFPDKAPPAGGPLKMH